MKLKITVDNKTYEVEVDVPPQEVETPNPRGYVVQPAALKVPAAATPPPATGGTAASSAGGAVDEAKVCRSPISGIVVKANAQSGQSIQKGDILLVLEAMKMETNITAPIAGKISKVNVDAGDSVQNGQVVVEFE